MFLAVHPAPAADLRPRVLTFASEDWLTIAIGTYQPGKGWVEGANGFAVPPPGELYTLFGNTGKLGEARGNEERRPDPAWTPVDWHARIERGETIRQPFALAILGSWPDDDHPAQETALDNPALLHAVSDFLKKCGLKVKAPSITQAYQVDLNGDGQNETLITAHSDAKALRDDQPAAIYAVALLLAGPPGREKTTAIAHQCSYKPSRESLADHEHHHGTRDFYRFIALHDIDGDGKKEITLYRAKDDATQVDVFTFNGRRAKRVLSAYKPNYN